MEDFVALSPLALLLYKRVHFLGSITLGAITVCPDHGPFLPLNGPVSDLEPRGWLVTILSVVPFDAHDLCPTTEASPPDARISTPEETGLAHLERTVGPSRKTPGGTDVSVVAPPSDLVDTGAG